MTVSELTAKIKSTLEPRFERVEVEGEVSNLRHATSGHYYFSLKDANALIGAALFRGVAATLSTLPRDGMRVTIKGRLSIYPQRGSYQIICTRLVETGSGAILAMLEQRKRLLAARGLFAPERKRALPSFITKAVIITSPHGAAVRDIIEITGRRNRMLNLVILPTLVQGEGAAQIICAQIARANAYAMGEVIVLTRGGGSLEDLLPFSEVSVVEAVASSAIPVVSAVGHEIDSALTDYAADLRAPTPSAAAELISTDSREIEARIGALKRELAQTVRGRLRFVRHTLTHYQPDRQKFYLQRHLQEAAVRIDDSRETLEREIRGYTEGLANRLRVARGNLEALSPRHILKRGYALVYTLPQRTVITDAAQVAPAQRIEVRFTKSRISATVNEKEEANEEL